MGRAIVREPQAFLMDEPLSNLDAKLRVQMRSEIRRLHQSLGLTTVYVTHDQEEALSLADRLVVLRQGRVQQIGTSEELHTRPANWHVADFMGFRNIVEVEATHVKGTEIVVQGEGLRLRGTATAPTAVGDRVVAAVRPEDVLVGAADGDNGSNATPATVEVVGYQGRELAVEVRTAAGRALHLRTEQRLVPGEAVTLTIDPERLLVYPLAAEEHVPAPLVAAVPS